MPDAQPQEGQPQQTTGQAPAGDAPKPEETAETAEARLARLERDLADARKEAAKYRTSLRAEETAKAEAERKAAEEQGQFKSLYEKTQAELKALQDAAAARERADLLRAVAKEAGLDESLADRLRGDDEAALRADAKALAERVKPAAPTGAGSPANGARSANSAAPAFDPKNPPRLSDPGLWKR
jgi:alanyl-tRNA synthetase